MASLFQACKSAVRNKQGGTFNIGGYDIDIELMTQQDIDDDVKWKNIPFGDNDESKILLVASETITIPSGYTLTPDKPKKSLVIFCNNLVNNGTISMYQKAPNVLPHDYFIIEGKFINSNKNLVIPAYANNGSTAANGIAGTDRQCGSGGYAIYNTQVGGNGGNVVNGRFTNENYSTVPLKPYLQPTGSGYAFGGGAGTGGICISSAGEVANTNVNSTYPMRGGSAYRKKNPYGTAIGGAGNPHGGISIGYDGIQSGSPVFGCGGRVIIFCCNFTNNGTITAKGSNSLNVANSRNAIGGASGGGAIDVFYTNLTAQGTTNVAGGTGYNGAGSGGAGSSTFTQWNLDKVIKEERKMFTKDNWVYLFNNYSQRLREDVI